MNPKMLAEKVARLQAELERETSLLTAPLRYLAYVEKHGTAFGKMFKPKNQHGHSVTASVSKLLKGE